jgi:hypothetical protein
MILASLTSSSGIVALVGLIVAVLALGLTFWNSRRQTISDRQAYIMTQMFTEWRTEPMTQARRVVMSEIPKATATEHNISKLPDHAQVSLRLIVDYLDHLGLLVKYDHISLEQAAGYFGASATDIHDRVVEYFPGWRIYFRWFVREMAQQGLPEKTYAEQQLRGGV